MKSLRPVDTGSGSELVRGSEVSGLLSVPPPGCDGCHLLGPEQECPSGSGAGGLLYSGPAERHEEDHLHRSVTFDPPLTTLNSDLYLTSTGPPPFVFPIRSGGTDY